MDAQHFAAGQQVTTYPSKRDWWITALLWLSDVALLASLPAVWIGPGKLVIRLAASAFVLLCAGLTLHVWAATAYDVNDDLLVIRSGPFRWRIPIEAIVSVKPSRSLLSGPALSLDRLHVCYNGSRWGVLISPADQEAFLTDLAGRTEHLTLAGGTVVRQL